MSEIQAAVVVSQFGWLTDIAEASRRYFGVVADRLQQVDYAWQHQFPAATHLQRTSFYQSGWILAPGIATENRNAFLAQLQELGVGAGPGFSGFHRRSPRRCRKIGELQHAATTANRTWVIHHHQALGRGASAEETAERILTVTAKASSH